MREGDDTLREVISLRISNIMKMCAIKIVATFVLFYNVCIFNLPNVEAHTPTLNLSPHLDIVCADIKQDTEDLFTVYQHYSDNHKEVILQKLVNFTRLWNATGCRSVFGDFSKRSLKSQTGSKTLG